ncbi:hypothetical protein EPI10_020339 [Gossypium australe]|uniref:Uncharacterized protein n=1 Tax=Gossypium australe TaxID=47621 RepID=A0A5B6WDY9_9ROSI|nr:hypothetical protein EPI10_020339 [Gossypium australe]
MSKVCGLFKDRAPHHSVAKAAIEEKQNYIYPLCLSNTGQDLRWGNALVCRIKAFCLLKSTFFFPSLVRTEVGRGRMDLIPI